MIQRAARAGAQIVTEPTELFFGDRVSRFRDPYGNLWWIHQRVVEVDADEAARRAEQPAFVEAMAYVTGAEFFPAG